MSRIGKKPIPVPAGVKVAVANGVVNIEGPKGKLALTLRPEINAAFDAAAKSITVSVKNAADLEAGKYWGTSRALLNNMIEGVNKGYEKSLEVVGVGWTAAMTGKKLKLVVGFANPIEVEVPTGLNVVVEKQIIRVSGPDKQAVGQFASVVRAKRKPEPYNGKGVKYTTETIKRKQGKQFGA
jgi:large subunit ribosomal protein L6